MVTYFVYYMSKFNHVNTCVCVDTHIVIREMMRDIDREKDKEGEI